MKMSDTFQKAKEVLLTQGWTKGTLDDGIHDMYVDSPSNSEPVCLLGAIETAKQSLNYADAYHSSEQKFLQVLLDGQLPEDFNDKSGSMDDIICLLDEATLHAKERNL